MLLNTSFGSKAIGLNIINGLILKTLISLRNLYSNTNEKSGL